MRRIRCNNFIIWSCGACMMRNTWKIWSSKSVGLQKAAGKCTIPRNMAESKMVYKGKKTKYRELIYNNVRNTVKTVPSTNLNSYWSYYQSGTSLPRRSKCFGVFGRVKLSLDLWRSSGYEERLPGLISYTKWRQLFTLSRRLRNRTVCRVGSSGFSCV